MQIGPKMATLQEKKQKWTLKTFFLKNPPGFSAFETSSSNLTSNRPFGLEPIYRDINFVLKCLPARCASQSSGMRNKHHPKITLSPRGGSCKGLVFRCRLALPSVSLMTRRLSAAAGCQRLLPRFISYFNTRSRNCCTNINKYCLLKHCHQHVYK